MPLFEWKTAIIFAATTIGFTAIASLAYAENGEHSKQQNLAASDMPAAM
jgi:hypothetical protein